MIETAIFVCSICGESSADICVYCTKDTCSNHRCERCGRCSDCCECEVPLVAPQREMPQPAPSEPIMAAEPARLDAAEPTQFDAPEAVGELSDPGEPPPIIDAENAWLAPTEATEEPDLNTPPAAVIEAALEQEHKDEKARPFPTNSIHDVPESAD